MTLADAARWVPYDPCDVHLAKGSPSMRCASCDTDNDAGSKFCMTCGSPLNGDAAPAEAAPAPIGHDLLGGAAADVPPPPADVRPPGETYSGILGLEK